ncbi:hypothetical protein RHECNPAF_3340096 [Rhizobium etli CNPAF512]|nr:hypothetical protein RHECNPAF_3340096 [Rhizobium etli CNPAF512]
MDSRERKKSQQPFSMNLFLPLIPHSKIGDKGSIWARKGRNIHGPHRPER